MITLRHTELHSTHDVEGTKATLAGQTLKVSWLITEQDGDARFAHEYGYRSGAPTWCAATYGSCEWYWSPSRGWSKGVSYLRGNVLKKDGTPGARVTRNRSSLPNGWDKVRNADLEWPAWFRELTNDVSADLKGPFELS